MKKIGDSAFREVTFGEKKTVGEMAFGDFTFIEITSKTSNLLKRVQRLYYTDSAVSLHAWLALIILAGHNK